VALAILILPGAVMGYTRLRGQESPGDAQSALGQVLPSHTHVWYGEQAYSCGGDDSGPPFCAKADVVLPGSSGNDCYRSMANSLRAAGYELLEPGPPEIDAVRGHDEVLVNLGASRWSCDVTVEYDWNFHPKTHF